MSHEKPPERRHVQIAKEIKNHSVSKVLSIGVAGNGGSFSEQAAVKYATERYEREGEGSGLGEFFIVYLLDPDGVLGVLEAGEIDLGVSAWCNNRGGIVKEYLEAYGRHRWQPEKNEDGSNVTIEILVEHMLMTRKEHGAITTIVTQEQAYQQCKETVDAMEGIRVLFCADTATAARGLADGTLAEEFPGISLEHTAVVGPEASAERYGLSVAQRDVHDHKDNKTEFIVTKRLSPEAPREDTLKKDETKVPA